MSCKVEKNHSQTRWDNLTSSLKREADFQFIAPKTRELKLHFNENTTTIHGKPGLKGQKCVLIGNFWLTHILVFG